MSLPFQPPPKATALLNARELARYKVWKYTTCNPLFSNNDSILLPTAEEYADFLEWDGQQHARQYGFKSREEDGDGEGEVRVRKCGHVLHPGHPFVLAQQQQVPDSDGEDGKVEDENGVNRCPMCTLQIHLHLLAELWDRWLDVGGPWRELPPGATGDGFLTAKRAYYKAKTGLVNAMDGLEDIAHSEAGWEVANPGIDVKTTRKYGATKAVQKYRSNIELPAELAKEKDERRTLPRKIQKKKRLSYCLGTPDDTRHRPNALFSRSMTSYDPDSPHACPDDEGWADYSFSSDWEYNVRQCRLLLCDKEPSLPKVTFRELTHVASKDHLIRALNHFFRTMDSGWVLPWTRDLIATADIFLVWKAHGKEQWFASEEHDCFDTWDKVGTLVGTNLEAYARRIRDIDLGNHEALQGPARAVEEDEEADDFFNQESTVKNDNSEDESYGGIADPMDPEDGEDEPVVDVVGEPQPDHTVPGENTGPYGHWLDKESER